MNLRYLRVWSLQTDDGMEPSILSKKSTLILQYSNEPDVWIDVPTVDDQESLDYCNEQLEE